MSLADYEVVIGLEVHCQLRTRTKMFSACPYAPGHAPNELVDPYTLGAPGTLPVPNARAVELAVRFGLAVGARIDPASTWARKHYFYPDLPKGYQITQNDRPYALGGTVEFHDPHDEDAVGKVALHHVHMEEDAGKNTHLVGEAQSLVDYNRAGAPLIEIVSEPDLRSAAEAAAYLRALRTLVRHLDISDANMEEGTLRCDANVSLRKQGERELGTKCEVKNLNSFKFLEAAIEAEARRQADVLDAGEQVVQSTMSFDPERGVTKVMRTKEGAADYRYFPEPDLPPLRIEDATVEAQRAALPELPLARHRRYRDMGLASRDAGVLSADTDLAAYFDAVVSEGAPAKKACNWVTGELLARANAQQRALGESPVSPQRLATLVKLVESDAISGRAAKEVFAKAWDEELDPAVIVERDGYAQVSDAGELQAIVKGVLDANPDQVEQFRAGKTKVRGFFVGQVMKQTRGQANPGLVNELLTELLKEEA